MSKIKIHELAKELDVKSKDIMDYLADRKIEVKSHMSSIEDDAAGAVRNKFGKQAEAPKAEAPKAEPAKEEVPKKKNIVHVFRPQNTGNQSGQRRQGGTRPQGGSAHSGMRPGARPVQADNGRPSKQPAPAKAAPTGASEQTKSVAQGSTNQSRPQGQGQARPQGQGQSRPQGQGQSRPQGQGQARPQGQGQSRPQGQGQSRPGGGNQRPYNQRGTSGSGQAMNRPGGGNRPGERRDKAGSAPVAAPIVDNKKVNKGKGKGKDDFRKNDNRFADGKKGKGKGKDAVAPVIEKPKAKEVKPEEEIKSITIPEILTIKALAEKMKIVPSVIVKKLFLQGKVVTVNQEIDYATAEEIALEFDVLCEKEVVVDVIEELLKEEEEDESKMVKRPPVVCVMGHVDHGKTSLLDAIRNTHVIDREAGGITQHIGAYVVDVKGEKITFLDTPGHEAFTAMRMRGASSTDIAILVVAADDGVMPQTVEAINHAKAAKVEIVVAVNKMDKPSANIDKVKQELAEYELIPEDWGGSTVFVPVSAKSGEGIDELMEMLLLTAEVLELKANPNRRARGLVIEAELDKGKGPVATVLVQKGTLRVGDSIAAGASSGKVRAMMDDLGRRVKEAGPSMPVEILGLGDVPNAGEVFVGCANDKEAKNFAATFISQGKERLLDDTKTKVSLDALFEQIKEGNLKELGIVVKADVQGSVEAIKQSLLKLSNDEVVVKIIHGGVGAINESDVSLASASNAIIIGFNVRPDASAKESAEREGVDLRLYRVIYSAIEDVEAAMKGMLDPVFEEAILGHAEVRQTFKASGVGTIAGGYVLDGTFERGCSVRVTRDGELIFEGKLASLKRFKDDVKEVRAGYECGLVFEGFNDVKEEDQVEAYKMVEVPR
ncbi:translation initiation factor IF-2 [Lachnospiraceae bacterium OttesenSCG-928-J05]|nr:translation initiation factor IF-2 [Lachnospiraceae bacterium OttesenSCG-928-J05]